MGYQVSTSWKMKLDGDKAINALKSTYKKSVAAMASVGIVAASGMGFMYINDNQLKIGLVPTGNIQSVSSTEGVVGTVQANREIQVVGVPVHNEMITVEACQITFSDGATTGDNSTFVEDLDCLDNNEAIIGTYTIANPGVQLTVAQIADKIDSIGDIYSVEHNIVRSSVGGAESTVFTSEGSSSAADIFFREGATSEAVLTSSLLGAVSGVAELDPNGKVPTSQIPSIAITNTTVVSNTGAMIALEAEEGDVAVVTDISQSFIHLSGTGQTISDWELLKTPTDTVLSVNGEQGAVSLDTDDVTEGLTNKYFTDARVESNGQVAANTSHRSSHSTTSDVVFNNITADGYIQFKTLSSSVSADCDDDAELSRMFFDTTQLRPYVCSKSTTGSFVWKPLDSDFDKDGVMEDTDVDDENADVAVCLTGYFWTEITGWISLDDTTNLDYCDPTSSTSTPYVGADGLIKGYSWSENVGYVHFNSTSSTASIW